MDVGPGEDDVVGGGLEADGADQAQRGVGDRQAARPVDDLGGVGMDAEEAPSDEDADPAGVGQVGALVAHRVALGERGIGEHGGRLGGGRDLRIGRGRHAAVRRGEIGLDRGSERRRVRATSWRCYRRR